MEASNLHFTPWVGSEYEKEEFKIFVMGISPYVNRNTNIDELDNNRNLSIDLVTHYGLKSDVYAPTFKGIIKLLYGEAEDSNWNKIIFSNYFQKIVGDVEKFYYVNKTRITDELIKKSNDAFFEILKNYKPNLVIVLSSGFILNKWLPKNGRVSVSNKNKLFYYESDPGSYIWCIESPNRSAYKKNTKKDTKKNVKPNNKSKVIANVGNEKTLDDKHVLDDKHSFDWGKWHRIYKAQIENKIIELMLIQMKNL